MTRLHLSATLDDGKRERVPPNIGECPSNTHQSAGQRILVFALFQKPSSNLHFEAIPAVFELLLQESRIGFRPQRAGAPFPVGNDGQVL